ncbi:P-loop containing nucleoside triphosphate hydrolase protein [Backusella circina FSU 941]|nr:P-loop containing nucleoside triphosphate hydrolase protein [Backusella circina FSU 941]
MVQTGLFQNTLIALPTGLGKTFIATVIMFNYWRWFPESKVIFLASTRPLVAQQIEACFRICGLPQSETIEMTGSINVSKRAECWKTKRVFFLTPQTMQRDLIMRICPAEKVVCLVVDEAHKAKNNYALSESHSHFYILALTATLGNSLDDVQEVVNNLHINNIQIRTGESIYTQEYTYGTTGVLPPVIESFQNDPSRNTPYGLMMSRLQFCENASNIPNSVRNKVTTTFMIKEFRVGKTSTSTEKAIAEHPDLRHLINTLKQGMEMPGFKGHPKLERLVALLLEHFSNSDEHAKVMVFSSFRSSMDEICRALTVHHPMIRCSEYVGQASSKSGAKGLKQAKHQQIINRFKNDELNTLVSTSIGEESVDIDKVDLIVCYDSQISPFKITWFKRILLVNKINPQFTYDHERGVGALSWDVACIRSVIVANDIFSRIGYLRYSMYVVRTCVGYRLYRIRLRHIGITLSIISLPIS